MSPEQKNRNIEELAAQLAAATDDNERAEMLRTLMRSCDFAEAAMQREAMMLVTERQHLIRVRQSMGWAGLLLSSCLAVQAATAADLTNAVTPGLNAFGWAALAFFNFKKR